MSEFTHINEKGEANMVDVTGKAETVRYAKAYGEIIVSDTVLRAVSDPEEPDLKKEGMTTEKSPESAAEGQKLKKGDILGTARIAGIMAAKRTPELIPLCHTLLLTKVSVNFHVLPEKSAIGCTCEIRLTGKTGAEMEALTGVSVALLTVYDMCKAVDKKMVIQNVRLLEKDGGKTGHFVNDETELSL